MRALKIATIAMGVLIIAATVLLVVLIIRRASPISATGLATTLHEPPGTRLIGITTTPSGLAVALQGGGPDRIVILDPRSMRVTGQVTILP